MEVLGEYVFLERGEITGQQCHSDLPFRFPIAGRIGIMWNTAGANSDRGVGSVLAVSDSEGLGQARRPFDTGSSRQTSELSHDIGLSPVERPAGDLAPALALIPARRRSCHCRTIG